MALRKILQKGDELLLKKSREVTSFDSRLHELLDDMKETLDDAHGAGLAAPQVGVLRRAFLVYDGDRLIECVNPVIFSTEGEHETPEGCLSVPDIRGYVIRPEKVRLRAFDRFGNPFEVEGTGMTAQAFCHENDHLDGVLFDSKIVRSLDGEDGDEE